jgi:hypothetical protein
MKHLFSASILTDPYKGCSQSVQLSAVQMTVFSNKNRLMVPCGTSSGTTRTKFCPDLPAEHQISVLVSVASPVVLHPQFAAQLLRGGSAS